MSESGVAVGAPGLELSAVVASVNGPRYLTRCLASPFVGAAPFLVFFVATWSVGEFCGYAFGDGGSSLRVK